MIRGLYIAATGMQTQQNRMDVVTNNLANASTTGYKEDTLLTRSFQDMMVERLDDPSVVSRSKMMGPLNSGIHIDEIRTSFGAGTLEASDLSTDLALSGDGFFVVQTAQGERYTKAGNFSIAADGTLTTSEGYAVLGQNGPIQVGNSSFTVSSDGRVTSANGNDQLRIVSFADNQGLRKEGGNLYTNYNTQLIEGSDAQVHQGFLETSNVDLTSQVVDMINIQRNYELNQRVIRMMDERLGRAVSEIGKL